VGAFTSSFNALFAGGLVEQVIALLQSNQAAAIAAYPATPGGFSPYGPLDAIADFHKGPISAPGVPCMTVVAGDPVFEEWSSQAARDYEIVITLHLDIRYQDPEQLADWSYHYARLLDQIFSTLTKGGADLSCFTTEQAITWPENTEVRATTPFAAGSVLALFIQSHHVGLAEGDENAIPGHRISLPLKFHLIEV